MKCYFCERDAQGQCQKDGRFVCKEHSIMSSNQLVCYEHVENWYNEIKEELNRPQNIKQCKICGKTIYDYGETCWNTEIRELKYAYLPEDYRIQLERDFPAGVGIRPHSYSGDCNCYICADRHGNNFTDHTIRISYDRQKCKLCGDIFYVNSGYD